MEYRRVKLQGATYFFTIVTRNRKKLFNHETTIQLLGNALRDVKNKWPYELDAICVLPEHIHITRQRC